VSRRGSRGHTAGKNELNRIEPCGKARKYPSSGKEMHTNTGNYWSKIQSHHKTCSAIHAFVGVAIAILAFDPFGWFSPISGAVGAFVVFSWYTIYEVIQWWTRRDSPTQEIGEAMIGFLATALFCCIL